MEQHRCSCSCGASCCTGGGRQPRSLSARGTKALLPFSPYIQAMNEAKSFAWSPTNPHGYFLMATAESVLSFDLIHDKIRSCREIPPTAGLYSNFRGGQALRNALAKMMQRTFMGVEIDPSHICISSGVTAVLDLFFFATCDPGDGCLIPAPYFPAFDNDMNIRNEVAPLPVQPKDTHTYIPTVAEMDAAVDEAAKRNVRARVLLITNPGNPLGTLYPEATLKELLLWAVRREMHVLSDEIYANSKFGTSEDEFVSLEKVAQNAVEEKLLSPEMVAEFVHTAYGMSKDFGMNGFRVGCLHTKNGDLLNLWQNMGMFAAVSNDTQHALAVMLQDDTFVDFYVEENKRRLKNSYNLLTSAFTSVKLNYMPACAAMFCWLDLRSLLTECTFEAERALWKEILEDCKVLLTPGEACHYAEPGFFRVCYASMPPEHLQVACTRLTSFVEKKRRKRKLSSA
ncbi:1-aminocyclopropane-1-carboxylate synthase [Selaginella moellendorffii]|uniref:1-aminocyclopropane-1-carboxylate synthase n=1 Tax=Selaginella moellendorffii TaxID=88036 RepID=UPI000D1CEDB9|nr:1-aminocyclopropane-1-carboxylate synthase [Selaginella moellendorffii]|eukprot:XP_024516430.1 1-aminocyclopropane-1-carboxylate synthase [Selaginella moellendorffii]